MAIATNKGKKIKNISFGSRDIKNGLFSGRVLDAMIFCLTLTADYSLTYVSKNVSPTFSETSTQYLSG